MWTAEIKNKSLSKGVLEIVVEFANGTESFGETYQVSSTSNIENIITSKIKQLNDLDALVVPLGAFVAKPDVIPTPDPKRVALQKLQELQELVKLGVLDSTDKDVTDAVQAVKDLM